MEATGIKKAIEKLFLKKRKAFIYSSERDSEYYACMTWQQFSHALRDTPNIIRRYKSVAFSPSESSKKEVENCSATAQQWHFILQIHPTQLPGFHLCE